MNSSKQHYLFNILTIIIVLLTLNGLYSCSDDNDDDNSTKSYLSCPDDKHPHMIDLGLPSGTKWACCNVGASSPEEYGGYYTYGEVSSTPSLDQIRELVDNCSYHWTTLNGVDGGRFFGMNGGSIFFPAAGYVEGDKHHAIGSSGYYWTSTHGSSSSKIAYELSFHYKGAFYGDKEEVDARQSVRLVR